VKIGLTTRRPDPASTDSHNGHPTTGYFSERLQKEAAAMASGSEDTPRGSSAQAAARTRGRPRNADADTAILAATRALLAERGWPDLTIAEVASRAGVAKTTLYRRWPGKADLVVDAMAELFSHLEVLDRGSMLQDALATVGQYVELLQLPETQAALLALSAEADRDDTLRAKVIDKVIDPQRHLVYEAWERACRRGEVEGETDIDLIFDMICGTLVHRILIKGQPVDEDYLTRFVSVVLAGLAQLRLSGGI
jgi:AcrR family transcriptional regulator